MQHTKYIDNCVHSWTVQLEPHVKNCTQWELNDFLFLESSRFAEAYVNKKEATFGVVFMSQCWCNDLISKCFDFTYLCP